MRSIHGRVDSMSKYARNDARSRFRWPPSVCSRASFMACLRSVLIARTTAAKISALDA
jgi:hypothetical protein